MIIKVSAFILSIFLIILRPIKVIKIGPFSNKIGHSVLNTIIEIEKNNSDAKLIFYYQRNKIKHIVSFNLFKKKILLLPYKDLLEKTASYSLKLSKSPKNLINRYKIEDSYLIFTAKPLFSQRDLKYFHREKILNTFGFSLNDKWICIHNRDEEYDKKFGLDKDIKINLYRNFKVSSFDSLINYALKLNYKIVRVGKIHAKKIEIKSKNIIDLPFDKRRNDYNEYFFISGCSLYFGTDSGIALSAIMFSRKVFFVNWPEIDSLFSNYKSNPYLVLPKLIIHKKKLLKFSEYLNFGVKRKDGNPIKDYNKFTYKQNDSVDILNLFKEALDLCKNNKKYDDNYDYFKMKNLLRKFYNFDDNKINEIKVRFPISFLNKYYKRLN